MKPGELESGRGERESEFIRETVRLRFMWGGGGRERERDRANERVYVCVRERIRIDIFQNGGPSTRESERNYRNDTTGRVVQCADVFPCWPPFSLVLASACHDA